MVEVVIFILNLVPLFFKTIADKLTFNNLKTAASISTVAMLLVIFSHCFLPVCLRSELAVKAYAFLSSAYLFLIGRLVIRRSGPACRLRGGTPIYISAFVLAEGFIL